MLLVNFVPDFKKHQPRSGPLCDHVSMCSANISVTRSDLLLPQCEQPVVCFVTRSLCIYMLWLCLCVFTYCDCVAMYFCDQVWSAASSVWTTCGLLCDCLCVFTGCDRVSVYWQRVSVTRSYLLLPQCPPQRSHSGLPVVLPQPACHQGQTTRNWRSAGSLALPFPSRPCWGRGDTGTTLVLCGISERRLRSEAGVARSAPYRGGGWGGGGNLRISMEIGPTVESWDAELACVRNLEELSSLCSVTDIVALGVKQLFLQFLLVSVFFRTVVWSCQWVNPKHFYYIHFSEGIILPC